MKNIKNDDEAIIFDRDTSAPKNKMRNPSGRRRPLKNNQITNQNYNNTTNQQNNNLKNQNITKDFKNEEEKEDLEEEVIEVDKKEKKGEKKEEKKEIKKEEKKEIKKEEKNDEKKEEKKETEPKIVIQIKKNDTNNSNSYRNNSNLSNRNNLSNKNMSNKNNFNNNNISNKNLAKKHSSCQVNLINSEENTKLIQELKTKVNKLIKEKQELIAQADITKKNYEEELSQKKQEINSLSQINTKLKKNLEKVSNQVNKLLDKVVEKNTVHRSGSTSNLTKNINLTYKTNNKRNLTSALYKYKLKDKNNENILNEENKDKDGEIESLKEKLNMKESQLKNSLNLIEFLSKDNKKLKLQYESLGFDKSNINNYKLMEEIKKKNKEIRQLEKEYKDLVSVKSTDKELEYYKNHLIQLNEANKNNESKIKKLKSTLEQYQNKESDINKKNINSPNSPVLNARYKLNSSNDSKSGNFKMSRNNQDNKERRSFSVVNAYDWRNPELNNNFSRLFNEKEKKALLTLFENEEDYNKFNQKINIIEKHYNSNAKRFQSNINELKQSLDDKDEQIAYLREKIRENEMKIKILLNQVHLERHKKDRKETNQQGLNKSTTKNS